MNENSVNWGSVNKNNYNVTFENGTLTITPKSVDPNHEDETTGKKNDIKIDTPKDVNYNGNSQEQPPKITDKDGNVLVPGKDYDISYSEDTTNVGTVTVKITGKGNYTDSTSYTYKITPIDLDIRVSDINTKFTGSVISPSKDGYVISGKLANGDEIYITLAGGKKNPGTYKNELYVSDFVIKRDGKDVTKNYNVKTIPGTLTISAANKEENKTPAKPKKTSAKTNTGVESKVGMFASMLAASGAAIVALLDRKNRK